MSEHAAEAGILAMAAAVRSGQARGLTHEEIAAEAYAAAEAAYAAAHGGEDDGSIGGSLTKRFDQVSNTVGNRPIVGRRGGARVGHGGGGHGGHGHGGRGFGFFGGGGWGWPYPYSPVVVACGPGQVLLADGTCATVASVSGIEAGSGVPDHAVACPIADDGIVTLPDGSTIDAHDLEWGDAATVGAALVGQDSNPYLDSSGDQGYTVGPGGSSTPLGGAAGMSGTQASNSVTADAIEANWVAVMQAPPLIPNWTTGNQTKLNSDHSNWEAFYAHIQGGQTLYLMQDLSPWQDIVDEWGDAMRNMAPNVTSWPSNFPTTPGGAGLSTTPLSDMLPSLPSLTDVTGLLEWAVIAVAVGVGLWIFWPALVATKGAVAAAL